ncbi:hypothetical protein EU527_02770 [Candidatus Thorarchaeota archaeon]|nr:MAG: hypothetical protein EU527_02770 [Candidatus Thorarchaeota archaeon]
MIKTQMIFKVLVIGRDIALQTGFLCRASNSNVTTQLFNTLGVSFGVARYDGREGINLAIQLWALPYIERLAGLTKNFTRGHRGVVLIIKSNELEYIPELLESFSIDNRTNIVITIIRGGNNADINLDSLTHIYEHSVISHTETVEDIIEFIAEKLLMKESSRPEPLVAILDETALPIFEPAGICKKESICSDGDVNEIRSNLLDHGLRVIDESCIVELDEGRALVSLRTGSVSFEPTICNFCLNDCKRKNSICIIAVDSGWSSQGIGQKALLTTAKIIALAERSLPNHVELQIQRACTCSRLNINPSIQEEKFSLLLGMHKDEQDHSTKPLLEVATDRLCQGKLSTTAFNMLKSRLDSIKKTMETQEWRT